MILRILLLAGLIFHKVIWEIWKRKYSNGLIRKKTTSLPKKILKLAKICFLLFLVAQALFLDFLPIENAPGYVQTAGIVIFLLGLFVSVTARIGLGRNWADIEDQQIIPNHALVTRGIYRYVRHPIYTGGVLLVIGFELAVQSWLFLLGLPIAMVVYRQACMEEELLVRTFPEYRDYCLQTKRFIPFVV